MSATLIVTRGEDYADAAAELWAAATAARDGDTDVAPLSQSRPLIDSVLEEQGSLIVLLESAGGEALAFATAQPSGDERANALVRYFAVHPRAWGEQFGARLARALPQALRDLGFERAWLLVYPDNERAVRLYERNGWRATGETSVNPRSGRQMMRYELRL